MKYCIKFATFEVFADSYQSAIGCAVSLSKDNLHVVIWQGNRIVWEYNNA